MKLLFSILFSLSVFILIPDHISAQRSIIRTQVKDTIPIEEHDYHLTKDQFLYYYGTDDTAKAIIQMFYRKRGIAILDFVAYPILGSFLGDAVIALGAIVAFGPNTSGSIALIVGGAIVSVVGFYGIPIYYLVQRSNYSRKKLIYALLSRERGMAIPYNILDNLRDVDFQ